jgi:hypothetical protein
MAFGPYPIYKMKISEKLKILPFGEPYWFSLNGQKLWQDVCDLMDIEDYHNGRGLKIKSAVKKLIFIYEVQGRGLLLDSETPTQDDFEDLEEMLQEVRDEFKKMKITPEIVNQSNSATPHPENINLDILRRLN